MMSSLTFTLFFAPHSSNWRFSSLSVSGTKLAMVRKVSSRVCAKAGGWRRASMLARPAAPPAADRRNCRRPGLRGFVMLDFDMWFPPFVARVELLLAPACARLLTLYLIAPEVKPET